MRLRPQDQDTICAQATPIGLGSIAVLRVSGDQSITILRRLCSFLPKKLTSHQAYFGSLSYQGEVIDEVVILYFEKGRSFTSETIFEICCHGSPVICSEILQALEELGCRSAQRGEFTYRAFLSGRIDLPQAESVLHLIEAESKNAKKQALRNLRGEFSTTVKWIQKQIQDVLSQIEAEIDFTEENLSLVPKNILLKKLQTIQARLENLTKNYKEGARIREGLKVGIFGRPNSGKSTLFNLLLREDKAIVSDIQGTTRDQVDGELYLSGQKIKIIDTAGIRDTTHLIEREGLKKALQALQSVDFCLYVVDSTIWQDEILDGLSETSPIPSHSNHNGDYPLLKQELKNTKHIAFVFNKIDLISEKNLKQKLQSEYPSLLKNHSCLFISAKEKTGMDDLETLLIQQISGGQGAVYLPRHYDHLQIAKNSMDQSIETLKKDSIELCAFELKEGLKSIQHILGINVDTDVVNQIFQQFCIGK